MEGWLSDFLLIGKGLWLTFSLLLSGLALGFIGALLFSLCRYQQKGVGVINGVISVIRGTPVILQLSVVYFAVPGLIGVKFSIFMAGFLTYGLNSAAYLSEIFRAGIASVPKGQFEAAKTLGISPYKMWKDIIFPQVLKHIFPALINETIALLKETALISVLGGMDIMRQAQVVAAEQFTYFKPLCIACLYYYGLVLLIEYGGRKYAQHSTPL